MLTATLLDTCAVLVFAATGALAASRAQLDPVGFIFLACLTAVGGGTLRDIILNRDEVFWIAQPHNLLGAGLVAMVVFFTAHLLESRARAIVWLDAAALAIAVPAGVDVAADLGHPWYIAMVMGICTGCLGGLMRDVVCNEVPLILRRGELYATAAAGGATVAALALHFGLPGTAATAGGALVTFLLRGGSLVLGWSLPAYRSRPPR